MVMPSLWGCPTKPHLVICLFPHFRSREPTEVSLLLPCHATRVGQRDKKLESQGPVDSGHGSPVSMNLPWVPAQTPGVMGRSRRNRPSWKISFTRLCPVRGTTLGPLDRM